jgi:hypothetical protein
MSFTTATVASAKRQRGQFQGLFDPQWQVTLTVDPASIAAAAEDTATFTVPGVALGDCVIAWSPGVDLTIQGDVEFYVSAANTLTLRISNLHASSALDLASSTWKVLIGRPVW